MSKPGRAVTVMSLLLALAGLFGCSKAPAYSAEDIQSVSVSCGHMDYSHSYAFYLRRANGGWLLDADYATNTGQPHLAFEECLVTAEDAQALLAIVQEQEVPAKLQRWKKPRLKVQAADETTYYTAVLLANGEQLGAAAHISDDLVNGFYRLAGKYAGTVPGANNAE